MTGVLTSGRRLVHAASSPLAQENSVPISITLDRSIHLDLSIRTMNGDWKPSPSSVQGQERSWASDGGLKGQMVARLVPVSFLPFKPRSRSGRSR